MSGDRVSGTAVQQPDGRVKPKPVLGKAAGAAVLGLAALASAMVGPLLSVPLALAAVIVAMRARRELKASNDELGGYGFSLTGFLLGGGVLAVALIYAAGPFISIALFFLFR